MPNPDVYMTIIDLDRLDDQCHAPATLAITAATC
jgi:hypothetical protein